MTAIPSRAAAPAGAPRRLRLDPTALAGFAAVAVLVFLVVSPLARLLVASFQSPETGDWTLANYATAFGRVRNLEVLGTSLLYAGAVTLVSGLLAVPVAWAVSRTDMPGKGFVRAMVLGAFITPPYLGAIGWILLAGPNAGWLNRAWVALTGAGSLFNVYSFAGLVLVTALYTFPYIFVFTSDALDRVSTEMEEAATILGSSTLRTTLRITLPLVTPAILAGAIIVFLDTVALFGTPAIIALPARIRLMTLQLWQYFEYPVRAEVAAAYSLPLVAITVALFAAQRLILGRRGYVALTGKGGARALLELGAGRWLAFAYAMLVIGLAVLLPFAALAQAAFSTAWGQGFSLGNLTLANFGRLFADPNARDTIGRTFLYAAETGVLAVVLAVVAAYVVTRKLMPGGFLLTVLCTVPLVIPGIVLAIGFYATYSTPPIALYGTAAILVLAFTTRFLPIAYVNAGAGLRSLNPEMEEAVRILGGGRGRALGSVVVPLLKKSLVGSWLLVFIPAVRELSTAIFLVGPNTRTISVMMLDLSENGSFETLAALGFVLLIATIAIVLAGYRIVGRDFMLRRG